MILDLQHMNYKTENAYKSFAPLSSLLLTVATDESLEVSNVKMVTQFNNQISQDALLLWLLESPELCKKVLDRIIPKGRMVQVGHKGRKCKYNPV